MYLIYPYSRRLVKKLSQLGFTVYPAKPSYSPNLIFIYLSDRKCDLARGWINGKYFNFYNGYGTLPLTGNYCVYEKVPRLKDFISQLTAAALEN